MDTYKTYGELKNEDRIYLEGYLFKVTNLRITDGEKGKTVRFEGICTEDKRNDSIRHTGYNGGTYGAYTWVRCLTEVD